MNRSIPLIISFSLIAVITLSSCSDPANHSSVPIAIDALEPGTLTIIAETAEAYPLPTVSELKLPLSESDSLLVFPGGYDAVLLTFWAAWCPPCLQLIEPLDSLRIMLPESEVLIVGLVYGETDMMKVADLKSDFNLEFPLAPAGSQISSMFGSILGLPTTFVINGNGKVVYRVVGVVSTSQFLTLLENATRSNPEANRLTDSLHTP